MSRAADRLERAGTPDHVEGAEYVQLGEHNYQVVPQRIGYLRNNLGRVFSTLTQLDQDLSSIEDVVGLLGDKVYDVLAVLIPDLMPRWEFQGYATEEALDGNDYEDRYDKSPTAKETELALRIALSVNRLDLFKHLGKIVDPTLLRGVVNKALADSMEASSATTSLERSSAPGSPDTPSTASGTAGSTDPATAAQLD